MTSIGGSAFSSCSGLTSVTIPDGVTDIGRYMFWGCSGLTSVTIPDSVGHIGIYAFCKCSGLKEVHISDIAAWCRIHFDSYDANPLYYAHNLYLGEVLIKDLVIPGSVTSIGSRAFYKCSGLTSVTIGDGVTSIGEDAFSRCSGLTSVTIPDSMTSIGRKAFDDCSGLTSVTIGDGVTSIGEDAFSGCSGLKEVHISDIASWCGISFGGYSANPLDYAHNLYLGEELITELVIPDSVTSIGGYAFSGCSGLTNVTIPDSVTSIGGGAFSGCSGLTSVTIPDSVTSMGGRAFSGCSGLTSVTIPDGVTSIGGGAFSGCSGLTSVTIGDSVTSIGRGAFSGCIRLTSVTIGDGVTSISREAFFKCFELKEVHISDIAAWCRIHFDSDDANPLYYANNLYLGEVLITDLVIPDSVTSIGDYAFYYCSGLTSVTIPDSVTSISREAFFKCFELKGVHISDIAAWCRIHFDSIDANPLYYAHNLYLGEVLITDLVIPDSVTSIGNFAFQYCGGLESIYIPAGVTSIGNYAFYNCNKLTTVNYGGSEEQWNAVSKGSSNYCLTSAEIVYNSDKPVKLTTIDAVKTSTDTAWQFTVTVGKPAANSYVYAAVYDAAGNITGMRRMPLEVSGSTTVDVTKTSADKTAKIFVWNSKMQPITRSVELGL